MEQTILLHLEVLLRPCQLLEEKATFAKPVETFRRDTPDLTSWFQCFSIHTTSDFTEKAREFWVYQTMIIGDTKRCGGMGWVIYDSVFRQQIFSFESANFSKI